MFKLMLVDPNMGFYDAAKEYFDGLPSDRLKFAMVGI